LWLEWELHLAAGDISMYPEDRVLVAYVPGPGDYEIIRREGWYRVPQRFAPKGLFAEYYAFYFGQNFGSKKWAIHYFARQRGYELVTRLDLLPNEPNHPRASDAYYKVTLGPLQQLEEPIVSLRWRRITFMHTTWDRFRDAREINDLFIEGGEYVDRLYATLKERGIQPERDYRIEDPSPGYKVPLAVICRQGRVDLTEDQIPASAEEVTRLANKIERDVELLGGGVG
jgi:hypothetical protein